MLISVKFIYMDIVIENLTKKYGIQKAVDNISLKVATGEILGFLGPNGAGKTTTMKIITNFIAPDEGKIISEVNLLRIIHMRLKRILAICRKIILSIMICL